MKFSCGTWQSLQVATRAWLLCCQDIYSGRIIWQLMQVSGSSVKYEAAFDIWNINRNIPTIIPETTAKALCIRRLGNVFRQRSVSFFRIVRILITLKIVNYILTKCNIRIYIPKNKKYFQFGAELICIFFVVNCLGGDNL